MDSMTEHDRRDGGRRDGAPRRGTSSRMGWSRGGERGPRDRGERSPERRQRSDQPRHDRPQRPREDWRETKARRDEERREDAQAREAVRRAAQERPEGGYSLTDFDDIPFHPEHRPASAAPAPERSTEGVRLQKVLANAGVASRRVCEDLITAGRVSVNGKVVTELGTRIDPETDKVVVNGTPVQLDQSKRYLLLNKPVGVVSTMRDEQGRPDLRRYTKHYPERLYNVGRLDAETSGLLILTNDGELAHVLAHPSFGVTKTYVAKVRGQLSQGTLQTLLHGIMLEDGPIKADAAHILGGGTGRDATLVEVTLHSGRNRIVRRMFEAVGHPVQELVRRSFGPLQLGVLREGDVRELTKTELGQLLKLGRRAEAAEARKSAPRERDESGQRDQRRGERGGDREPRPRDRPQPREERGRDDRARGGRREDARGGRGDREPRRERGGFGGQRQRDDERRGGYRDERSRDGGRGGYRSDRPGSDRHSSERRDFRTDRNRDGDQRRGDRNDGARGDRSRNDNYRGGGSRDYDRGNDSSGGSRGGYRGDDTRGGGSRGGFGGSRGGRGGSNRGGGGMNGRGGRGRNPRGGQR